MPDDSRIDRIAAAQARCLGISFSDLQEEPGGGDGVTDVHCKAFWRWMAAEAVKAMEGQNG